MRFLYCMLPLVCIMIFSGCGTTAVEMVKMEASSSEERNLQTKSYETNDYIEVFAASLSTMQDLGFNVDLTNKELGIISGSKSRDATEVGEQAIGILLALFGANITPALKASQDIRGTVVVIPKDKKTYVRLTVQRILYNAQGGVIGMETIKDAEIYTAFFDKLSKGIFLEDNL